MKEHSVSVDSLPDEVIASILIRLDPTSLALSAMACKRLACLIKDYQLRRIAIVRALGVKEVHGEAGAIDAMWESGLSAMICEPFR